MKKKLNEEVKKLSLEKFKVAELKNPKVIFGGDRDNDAGVGTATSPTSRQELRM